MTPTNPTSFRLPAITLAQLDALCELTGQNRSSVVTMAIDRMYQREFKTMGSTTYRKFVIEAYTDSLGAWHATIFDPKEQMTVGNTPAEGEYGHDTESIAITTAKALIDEAMDKGY